MNHLKKLVFIIILASVGTTIFPNFPNINNLLKTTSADLIATPTIQQLDQLSTTNDVSSCKHQITIDYKPNSLICGKSYNHLKTRLVFSFDIEAQYDTSKINISDKYSNWHPEKAIDIWHINQNYVLPSPSYNFHYQLFSHSQSYQLTRPTDSHTHPSWTLTPSFALDLTVDSINQQILYTSATNPDYHQSTETFEPFYSNKVEGKIHYELSNMWVGFGYDQHDYDINNDPQVSNICNLTLDGLRYDEIANDHLTLHLANSSLTGIHQLKINQKLLDLPSNQDFDLDLNINDVALGKKTSYGTSFQITFLTSHPDDYFIHNYLICNSFNPQLETFSTDEAQTQISSYQGYLNGDPTKPVNVISALNFQDGASTKITLHNQDQLLALANPQDMSGSWLQLLDTNYQPIDKPGAILGITSEGDNDLANKTPDMQIYKLVLKDQLNNELDYYVQLGGKVNHIPAKPTKPLPTPDNSSLSSTLLLVIISTSLISVFLVTSIIYRYCFAKKRVLNPKSGASKK